MSLVTEAREVLVLFRSNWDADSVENVGFKLLYRLGNNRTTIRPVTIHFCRCTCTPAVSRRATIMEVSGVRVYVCVRMRMFVCPCVRAMKGKRQYSSVSWLPKPTRIVVGLSCDPEFY